MSSSSLPDMTGPERLPVNPRRKKVPIHLRRRVQKACNSCNLKRIRCSGQPAPCDNCVANARECVFPAPTEKVVVSAEEYHKLLADAEDLRAAQEHVLRLEAETRKLDRCIVVPESNPISVLPSSEQSSEDVVMRDDSTPTTAPSATPDFDNGVIMADTEGGLLKDQKGQARWIGGSSGAKFLHNLCDFMVTIMATCTSKEEASIRKFAQAITQGLGRHQTPETRSCVAEELSRLSEKALSRTSSDEAARMLGAIDYFAQSNASSMELHRDGQIIQTESFPSGGIFYVGDLKAKTWTKARNNGNHTKEQWQRVHAFYQAAFAYGSLFSSATSDSRRQGRLSEAYAAKAQQLLGGNNVYSAEYGLADVPTLALLALYMNEINRRDSCSMIISCAIQICYMHGIHCHANSEAHKRVFWTIYVLDRWMSCLMGRPHNISDEVISVSDPAPDPKLPPVFGLLAHVQLARIAGHIVRSTYNIAPPQTGASHQGAIKLAESTMRQLQGWLCGLPVVLRLVRNIVCSPLGKPSDAGLALKTYYTESNAMCAPDQYSSLQGKPRIALDRGGCALHMYFNQLMILTLRPIFFSVIKSLVAAHVRVGASGVKEQKMEVKVLASVCVEAARQNIAIGSHIHSLCSPSHKLMMMDLHHIFNAAIILQLHHISAFHQRGGDIAGIAKATEIFSKEASTGGSYGVNCHLVLTELSDVVHSLRGVIYSDSDYVDPVPKNFINQRLVLLNSYRNSKEEDAGESSTLETAETHQDILKTWELALDEKNDPIYPPEYDTGL